MNLPHSIRKQSNKGYLEEIKRKTQRRQKIEKNKEGKKWKRKFRQGNDKEERRIERDIEKKRDNGKIHDRKNGRMKEKEKHERQEKQR